MAGLMIAVLNEMQRRATRRAESAHRALLERQREIEALNQRLQRAMTETYHRVKNNLQLVAALVEMTLPENQETVHVDKLRQMNQHIRALAAINDLLTRESRSHEEVSILSSRLVLEKLLALLVASTGERHIRWHINEVALTVKQGAGLALVVNELVSNGVKHGLGEVELSFDATGGQARLEVCDDGPGFPHDFEPKRAASTGLELIESLCLWDLGGEVAYLNRPAGGGRVVVTFPLTEQPVISVMAVTTESNTKSVIAESGHARL
jgi:two-component sensor histidine kinase